MQATHRRVLALLLAACALGAGLVVLRSAGTIPLGTPSTAAPPAAPPATGNTSAPEPQPPSAKPGPIELALGIETDRPSYTLGDTVSVTVILINVGNDTVVLGLPDPCAVVFLAYNETGQVTYNWTRHNGCIQVWWDLALAPGASQTFVYRWSLVTDNGTAVPAPATYSLVPLFMWHSLYQDRVVRTETKTINVIA